MPRRSMYNVTCRERAACELLSYKIEGTDERLRAYFEEEDMKTVAFSLLFPRGGGEGTNQHVK